jgi:hypothetical protein
MSKAISYYDWSLDSKKKLSETSKCNNPDCRVLRCYSKKDVDFCFQCEELPCNNTKFDDDLKTRWIQMNKKMKEIGVKRYYQEIKEAPRYK